MALSLILIPLLALIVLNLPVRAMRSLAAPVCAILFLAQAALAAAFPFGLWNRIPTLSTFFPPAPLAVDLLSAVVLLAIGLVAFAALLVAHSMLRQARDRFNFTSLLLIAVTGLNGTAMATDLFSLWVFIEVAAVASFVLVAFPRDAGSLEGAFKYLVLSAVATIFMLSGIALLMMLAGDVSFAAVAGALKGSPRGFYAQFAAILFLCGLLVKAGLMPFHGWVPDTYSMAPPAVAVLLGGIASKVSGMYPIIRVVAEVFGPDARILALLLAAGAVSVVGGALAALGQKDLRRMLAYSSISQMGYIVLGLGCGTPLGVAGAVFHFLNHAIFKAQLFVNAAALEQRLHTRDMDRMGGLSARMPWTGHTSLIAFLSTAGIPPLSGFWSKLIIIIALWNGGHWAYALVAVLTSVLTLAYFLAMQRRIFFGKLAQGLETVREARAGIVVAAALFAAITVGVGLAFPFFLDYFILPAGAIIAP